jgi:hypothetical protein
LALRGSRGGSNDRLERHFRELLEGPEVARTQPITRPAQSDPLQPAGVRKSSQQEQPLSIWIQPRRSEVRECLEQSRALDYSSGGESGCRFRLTARGN